MLQKRLKSYNVIILLVLVQHFILNSTAGDFGKQNIDKRDTSDNDFIQLSFNVLYYLGILKPGFNEISRCLAIDMRYHDLDNVCVFLTSSKNTWVFLKMCFSSVSSRKFLFRASAFWFTSRSSFSSFSKVACIKTVIVKIFIWWMKSS